MVDIPGQAWRAGILPDGDANPQLNLFPQMLRGMFGLPTTCLLRLPSLFSLQPPVLSPNLKAPRRSPAETQAPGCGSDLDSGHSSPASRDRLPTLLDQDV